MPVYKPKGLTSADRTDEEKKAIAQQGGVSVQLDTLPSFHRQEFGVSSMPAVVEYNDTLANQVQDERDKIAEKYHLGEEDNVIYGTENENIKKVARKVSPFFQKYEFSDKVQYSPQDWTNLYLDYEAQKKVLGENQANQWLAGELQDHIASNQSIAEKAYNGFRGMGASAAGAAVGLYGNLVGLADFIAGKHEKIEGVSGLGNLLDSMMDNDITRYGDDMVTYGTWRKDRIEALKNGSKISDAAILETREQENSTFDINTLPTALQNGGFTVLSMFTGVAEAKLAQWAFRSLKAGTLAARGAKTVEDIARTRNVLRKIQNAERINNAFVIPALAGTTEGFMEGLQTKRQALEEGRNYLASFNNKRIQDKAQEYMVANPGLSEEEALNQATDFILNDPDELKKYEEAVNQIDFAATRAGINNFYANSAINGIANMTLKAGLQAPRVQTALQKSKLTSWATPKGNFTINKEGQVAAKYGIGKQAWNIIKEPLGEFSEEYLQTLSDAAARGGAENNIHAFIDNKYNGDSMAEVGDYMSGDIAAAFTALEDTAVSKDALEAGIYGAISSILGTPAVRARDYTKQVIGSDGKYHTKIDLGRREGENLFETVTRLMPWRSGLGQAIRETKAQRREFQDEAKVLNEWIQDPSHREKFDGVIGTWSWAKQIEDSGNRGDEFGYRNSLLGKTINDAMMLEKLRGTSYYDSFMNEVVEASQLEEGTPEAAKYISALRDNVEVDTEGRSDADLVEDLRNNAQKLLETMTKIQDESDIIERTLGPVDEDTKQALIYGQMAIEDWENRGKKLQEELKQATSEIENTTEGTNLSDIQKKAIATYGSLQKAESELSKLKERATTLSKMIESGEKTKKNLTDAGRTKLLTNKAQLKAINKHLKQFEGMEIDNENPHVLNEQQIMALDPASRAVMLDPKNLSKFSQAQQDVINNLTEKATAKDRTFTSKAVDAGRIAADAEKFYKQYAEISKDPGAFNRYTQRARQAAADALTAKRFESLNSIKDYNSFASEMDNIFDNSSMREQALVSRALSKSQNPMYERYKADRKELSDLMDQIVKDEDYKDLEDNDKALFASTLSFLKNHGVNLNDNNSVVGALSATEENGKTAFENYVDQINSKLSEPEQLVFTSPGEIIQTFKDVMGSYKRDQAETVRNERPVTPSPLTTPADSTPASEVKATPKQEKEKKEEEVKEKKPLDTLADSVIETIQDTENKELIDSMNRAVQSIEKSHADGATKAQAMSILTEIGEVDYDSPLDLSRSIDAYANRLLVESADGTSPVVTLLKQAAVQAGKTESAPTIQNIFSGTKQATSPDSFAFSRPVLDTNAGIIDPLDHSEMRRLYPDGTIVKYLDRWGVDDYLRSDKLKRGTKVYFVSPSEYAQETKTEIESKGGFYNLDNEVLVAVVEDENGPMTIGDKKYQPIGIMPRTSSERNNGAARLGKVRKLAQKTGYDKLVADESGNPVVTTLGEPVRAKAPEQLEPSEPNHSIQTIQMNDLSKSEREQLQQMSPAERRNSSLYQKMKTEFLKHFKVSRRGNGTPYLSYGVPNLKGEETPFEGFVTPVQRTRDINQGKLISELFNTGDVTGILNGNSRLRRASREMVRFFENFNDDIMLTRTEEGLVPIGDGVEILEKAANDLTKKMANHLSLPVREGWKYKITPLEEMIGEGENARRAFRLSIENTDGREIELGRVARGNMTEQTQFNILRNLIMDGTSVRMRDNKNSFVIWQVNFNDVGNDADRAKANISDIYDDDIIDFSKASLKYVIRGVPLQAPFTLQGEPAYRVSESAISDNATTQPITSQPTGQGEVKRGNATIDTDTGVVVEGRDSETYEVSTAGDKRFSALNAKLKDGRTIEEAYQLDVKGYRSLGYSWKQAKADRGRNAPNKMTPKELYQAYKGLWRQWASENPELIEELRRESEGKTLTDRFASGGAVSQARALTEILQETQSEKRVTREEVRQGSRMRDRRVKRGTSKQPEVKPQHKWGVWEGRSMSPSEIQDILGQKGYTEESWNKLSEEMKDHELDCCGA